ncbi:hypothetical protein Y032_0062g3302 [Ancylostoma ceylanicum]|uniref:Uncharacterized protein n=1 Tax=Ancylostoma ceylanicum TaxID=53326 RepID=A0A016U2D8_9BILA|nr:hypothetical protein Y032_0062g3302 [Ancylostoma ceylanicum]
MHFYYSRPSNSRGQCLPLPIVRNCPQIKCYRDSPAMQKRRNYTVSDTTYFGTKKWEVPSGCILSKPPTDGTTFEGLCRESTLSDSFLRLVYNYNVSWTEKTNESFKIWERMIQQLLDSKRVAINVPVRCDGPCGGMTDVDYVQFGLCEHIICRKCYETVKGADHDGLHGCCNADCLELARNERHQRRRAARKEDRGRAKRVRSDVTFRMEYDNKDFEHLMENMRKGQKSPTQSARSDSCMTSFHEPAFSQS